MTTQGVQFEENNYNFNFKSRQVFAEPQSPQMIQSLVKSGLVKSEKSALFILLSIIIISIAGCIYFLFFSKPASYDIPSGYQIVKTPTGQLNLRKIGR